MGEPTVIPVAVIGMACRLPGGIDSPELLWEALLRGDHLITEIPADRWDADEYYDPERGVPGRSMSRWGAFLDDVAGFDPEFFGIEDRKAAAIDPQHRVLMETVYSTHFPTFERSHYARVIASCNECCSDARLSGCESAVAKPMKALTDAVVAPASGRIFSAMVPPRTGRRASEPEVSWVSIGPCCGV